MTSGPLGLRLVPTRPGKGASRLEVLCYLRRNYFFGMALLIPMFVIGLVASWSIVLIVCAGGWLVNVCGAAVLSVQIRAERRKTQL
jgi:hypothetical protein